MNGSRSKQVLMVIFSALVVSESAVAENEAEVMELGTVEVISTTPLPSLGTPIEEVPSNVQVGTAKQLNQQKSLNLGEYLDNNLGSVNTSNSVGNPYQMDVSFRGFTATPILGSPSGMSVYLDGVRFNEPFGDIVNWDLIPTNAIASINLIPGSNPLFGLNTLGGALAVNTKSGSTFKGGQVTLTGGSWGRKAAQFEYGAEDKARGLDFFVAGNVFSEDGWLKYSSSNVRQVFSKLGWHDDRSDLDLSVALADNAMKGTQSLPLSMLGQPRNAYTYPDTITNKMAMIALKGTHFMADDKLISGNVYYRMSNATNFNSNAACDEVNGCPDMLNGSIDPAYAGAGDIDAQNVYSRTYQDGYGGALQFSYLGDVLGHKNSVTVGASADLSRVNFNQDSQGAGLISYQTVTDPAIGLQDRVRLHSRTDSYGIYATDNMAVTETINMTLSGRYNVARVNLNGAHTDYSGGTPAANSLNGSHQFQRLNPALGLTYRPLKALNFYGGYNEGMRAPTPVELACADPNFPCSLPTGFNSDPPLSKVVAKTWEGGVRGKLTHNIAWNVGVYNTRTMDDIQFIAFNQNVGIFQNVGQTDRRGVELGLSGKLEKLAFAANYGFVDATFQSVFNVNAPANSSADSNGMITVHKGDRIPGIARQSLKFRLAYDLTPDWYVGSNLIFFSGQYAHGDQNNQDVNGRVPGYAVVNLDSAYRFNTEWSMSLKVSNLFDRRYATYGQLGENIYANNAPEQFRTPSAPRAAWLNVTYQFGRAAQVLNAERD
jgi:iron complex outermembrane recepter protein